MANEIISADEMARSVLAAIDKSIEGIMPDASEEEKQQAKAEVVNALANSFFMY